MSKNRNPKYLLKIVQNNHLKKLRILFKKSKNRNPKSDLKITSWKNWTFRIFDVNFRINVRKIRSFLKIDFNPRKHSKMRYFHKKIRKHFLNKLLVLLKTQKIIKTFKNVIYLILPLYDYRFTYDWHTITHLQLPKIVTPLLAPTYFWTRSKEHLHHGKSRKQQACHI